MDMTAHGTRRVKVEDVMARQSAAEDARRPLEPDMRDIAKYVIPSAMEAWGMGVRAQRGVVNDTAVDACEDAAAGIDGLLFGGANYFVVKMKDSRLNERDDVKAYTGHMTKALNMSVQSPRSGFEVARQNAIQSVIGFGTMCVYSEDNVAGRALSYRHVPVADLYLLDKDAQGRPSGVQVVTKLSAREAVAKFRSMPDTKLPERVTKAAQDEKRASEKFTFLHEVRPREDFEPGKRDALSLPFSSVYVCTTGAPEIVTEGGYNEQPYHTARWKVRDGSAWGWGPGTKKLPTIKRVNNVGRTDLKAAHRTVEPSYYVNHGAFKSNIDRRPNAITFTKPDKAGNAPEIRKWPGPDALPFGLEIEQRLEDEIDEGFYADILNIPVTPNMTASEYFDRVQKTMRRVGSPVGNIQNEFALPIGKRSFMMLWRARQFDFDRMPQVLQGLPPEDFVVDFVSPLEAARQAAEADSILRTAEGFGIISKFDPGAMDYFDGDAAARGLAEANKAPEGVVRDREAVQAMRQERSAKQQQEAELAMAERMVQGAGSAADALQGFANIN